MNETCTILSMLSFKTIKPTEVESIEAEENFPLAVIKLVFGLSSCGLHSQHVSRGYEVKWRSHASPTKKDWEEIAVF